MARTNWDAVVDTLNPILNYHFDEASGPAEDHGSAGVDATVQNTTRLVEGALGADEAIAFNGVVGNATSCDLVTIPYSPKWANFYTFEVVFLLRYHTGGGHLQPRFMARNRGPNLVAELNSDGSWNNVVAQIRDINSTNPSIVWSATKEPLPVDEYCLFTFMYDDTGERRPRMTLNGNEVVYHKNTQYPPTSQMTSADIFQPFLDGACIGNNNLGLYPFKIDLDEFLLLDFHMTPAQRRSLVAAMSA